MSQTIRATRRQRLTNATRVLLSYASAVGFASEPAGTGVAILLDCGEWKTVFSTDDILAIAESEARSARYSR